MTGEWHDSRLVPWVHFVPFDSTHRDLHAVLAYFAGMPGRAAGRERAAREIADAGAEWAARVLRREDMQVYVYRVVLELARVMADAREGMGYVEDLR